MLDPNMDMNQHPMDPHLQQVAAQGNNLLFWSFILFSCFQAQMGFNNQLGPPGGPCDPNVGPCDEGPGGTCRPPQNMWVPLPSPSLPDWIGGGHKDVGWCRIVGYSTIYSVRSITRRLSVMAFFIKSSHCCGYSYWYGFDGRNNQFGKFVKLNKCSGGFAILWGFSTWKKCIRETFPIC